VLIVSPSTANAITPHASERAFVMFVQVNPPGGVGPILIEGTKGAALGRRLGQLARDNAFDARLIGLYETTQPEQTAYQIRSQHDDDRVHDDWFEPTTALLAFIQQAAQQPLQELLAQTHPGAMEATPVDIDAIASLLGVSVKTIRRMVDKNQIPYLRAGRVLRFVPADVIASLQHGRR
jgi:excisionase family DNA binding protein